MGTNHYPYYNPSARAFLDSLVPSIIGVRVEFRGCITNFHEGTVGFFPLRVLSSAEPVEKFRMANSVNFDILLNQ